MKLLYSTVLFLLLYSFSFSQNYQDVFRENELTGMEVRFFAMLYKSKGRMSFNSYYDAFLVSSDITDNKEFISYSSKLNDIRYNARKDLRRYINQGNAKIVGEKLLHWLYDEEILVQYKTNATLAQNILDSGTYNCLNSSILYGLLLKEFGFKVKGTFAPNHAFIKLITEDGKEINVETTHRYGFDADVSHYSFRNYVELSVFIASIYENAIGLLGYYLEASEYQTVLKKMHYISPNYY